MSDPIVVGIDIGTTKICTLLARLEVNQTCAFLAWY
jgi:cell division ATPase FtsA